MGMFGMVVGIVATEGWIKKYMEQHGKRANRTYGKVSIRHCQNKGAMYSIGQKRPEFVKNASLAITVGIVWKWLTSFLKRKNTAEKIGYSMLLGGSMSNGWDRWKRGYVVDYIHINVAVLKKIIFNLSDICIVFGGILVTLAQMLEKKNSKE